MSKPLNHIPLNHIIVNGLCISEEEARIPAVTSGLYYGAGCFETFIADDGKMFKFSNHIERLNRGLQYLGVSDQQKIQEQTVVDQIQILLDKNNQLKKRVRIRIQISLTEKGGYSKTSNSSFLVLISSSPAEKKSTSQKLILSETSVVPSSARPSELKLSNMLHYRQAYRYAQEKKADDAVLVNIDGFVAETSIANIFWSKQGKIFTPSDDCDILPGIMRDSIIEIIRNDMNRDVETGRFSMDELLAADSVWITNSVIEFVPVSKIENISFTIDKSFFSKLRELLKAYKIVNITDV